MPYIGLILAILIIIFQGTIRQYTSNLVGSWLISALKTSTQGNYTLDYDFVRFDVFTKELRIQNLNLELDSTVIQEEAYLEKYSNLIDLSTPVVVMKLESLWDLIVNDKLRIAYIGMMEPRVNLVQSKNLSEEQNKENQQQTAETIRSYLNEIEIDSFRIINGSLSIDLQNNQGEKLVGLRVGDFSTLLRGFQLNEINPNRLFQGIYVNEIELEVLDQEINLPQFHHKLNFERLWVSSLDSIIELDTIRIIPTNVANATVLGNLDLRKIAFKSIDFRKAYDQYILDIGLLELNEADLSLIRKLAKTTTNGGNINLSAAPFKSYIIRNVNVTDSKLDLSLDRKISIANFNLNLRNYQFDTVDLNFNKLKDNIQEFKIDLLNSRFELPDSIHEVKVGLIHIDSKVSKARLSNVVLNPIDDRRKYQLYKKQGTRLINYASVRQVIFEGLNYDQLIRNKQLMVDSIYIVSPRANTTEYPYIKPIGGNSNDFAYLVNKVKISNGSIKYNKRQNNRNNRSEANGINIEISGLFPEKTSPNFDNLELQIDEGYSEIRPINHVIRFKNLSSLDLRRLDIGELELKPDSTNLSTNKYNLNSTGLSVIAYNRDFLANEKEIRLEELSAQSLSLDIKISNKKSQNKEKSKLEDLILNRFYFNNGNISYEDSLNRLSFRQVSTFVDSLHYNLNDTVSSVPATFKDLMISHADFEIELKNNSMHISGDLGKYSENDSLISFSEITYKTDNKLNSTLTDFQISGFNRRKLLANKSLEFEHLIINGHKLRFEVDTTATKSDPIELNNSLIRKALLSTFNELKFDSLSYRGGNIELISQERSTLLENCNITIRDYVLDTTTTLASLFKPETLNFNISAIKSRSAKDTVEVSGVSLDILNKTVFTGNIAIAFYDLATKWQVDIPGLIANGFDISKIIEGDYSLDSILLDNAKISLHTKDSSNNTLPFNV